VKEKGSKVRTSCKGKESTAGLDETLASNTSEISSTERSSRSVEEKKSMPFCKEGNLRGGGRGGRQNEGTLSPSSGTPQWDFWEGFVERCRSA